MRYKAGRVVREADPYGCITRGAAKRADVGIGPYGRLHEVQWADRGVRLHGWVTRAAAGYWVGDREGRPYGGLQEVPAGRPMQASSPILFSLHFHFVKNLSCFFPSLAVQCALASCMPKNMRCIRVGRSGSRRFEK